MKIEEIIEKLHQPIPNNRLSQKTVKGNRIDYVAWKDLCEILDERLGMGSWSWKIKDIQHFGNRLILTGGLTVYAEDGTITRESLASVELEDNGSGDPYSQAEEVALSFCCAKFGLGRDLWRTDS